MTISLIAAGLRAPSGDNTQPWRFEHRADGFALRFVPERSRSLMDCTTFASRIAAGALLENARLEALANGHVLLTYRVDPDPGDPTLWAEASVAPSTSSQTDDLHIAIPTRESNRCLFNGRPLAPGLAMALIVREKCSRKGDSVREKGTEKRGQIYFLCRFIFV